MTYSDLSVGTCVVFKLDCELDSYNSCDLKLNNRYCVRVDLENNSIEVYSSTNNRNIDYPIYDDIVYKI